MDKWSTQSYIKAAATAVGILSLMSLLVIQVEELQSWGMLLFSMAFGLGVGYIVGCESDAKERQDAWDVEMVEFNKRNEGNGNER